MSKAGTTVFVTTHYMDEADYCDRLALIYRGAIIAEGTPSELRQKHMTRDVLEIETENAVLAMEALGRQGVETAIFGSVLHATVASAPEDSTGSEACWPGGHRRAAYREDHPVPGGRVRDVIEES